MNFYEVVNLRSSIRKYRATAVEPEKLEQIWRAVQVAPSACNTQPWRFLVVKSPEMRARLQPVLEFQGYLRREWFTTAPLIIIALGNRQANNKENGDRAYSLDVAVATEHLVLAAAAEGLGTCWVCDFDKKALQEALGISPEWVPIAVTPLGYPDEPSRVTPRKPIEEIVQEV
jgi:nitroreductase